LVGLLYGHTAQVAVLGALSRSRTPTRTTSTATAPTATRAQSPTWRDPRLWLGLLLVAASVAVGARLLAAADESVSVWSVAQDSGSGTVIDPSALEARRVRFVEDADLARYFLTSAELPAELYLTRPVGAGELLARSAIGSSADEPSLQLPVKVSVEAVPPSVKVGSRVDLYVSDATDTKADARLLLQDVVVVAAPTAGDQFGATTDRRLVLAVPESNADELTEIIAATTSGSVTVVRRNAG
jgi:hypothetical protein